MSAFSPRRCAAVVAPVLALGGVLLGAAPASATSPAVLLNEVYGGGGNAGATWRNDFIELFNKSGAAVDLTGWQVQYWSAGAAAGAKPSGTTSLTGTVSPGGHYLVQEAAGSNAGATALPTPDATGTIALSGTAGRVAVVDASGAVVDLLGWGGAAVAEGSPAGVDHQHHLRDAQQHLRRHRRQRGRLRHRVPHPAEHRDAARGLRGAAAGRPPHHRRDPGLGTPVTAGRQAGRRRAGGRHRARAAGVLDAVGHARRGPRHQRGHLRLHPHRPDRRGR